MGQSLCLTKFDYNNIYVHLNNFGLWTNICILQYVLYKVIRNALNVVHIEISNMQCQIMIMGIPQEKDHVIMCLI